LQGKTINKIVRKGIVALKKRKVPVKEVKRFADIYKTVYRHARKKGQTHKNALSYCWNVYEEQAHSTSKKIIKSVVTSEPKMKFEQKSLRNMILKEMLEGEVINFSNYSKEPPTQELEDVADDSPYNAFLSEMHNQMMSFINEEFDNMTPEQVSFLDEILDSIESVLGIDEEGIDFDGDEEEDFEDEDL